MNDATANNRSENRTRWFSRFDLFFKIAALAAAFVVTTGLSAFVVFSFLTRGGGVEVPDVTGQEIRAALELASRSDLGLRITGTGHDPSIPPGHIVSQDPDPGILTRKNRIIMVTVSQGTPTVLVPDLTGLNVRRARLQLTQSGLKVGSVARTHVRYAGPDTIVTQTPHPRLLVSRGTEVDVLVSDGPAPTAYVIPDLTGLPVEEVLGAIRGWGLASGRISEVEDDQLPPGTVVDHDPAPGSDILEGEVVHITVSTLPEPTLEMPVFFYRYEAVGLLDRELTFVLVRGDQRITLREETVPAGTSLNIPLSITYPGIMEVYEDGYLIEERAVP